MRRESIEDRYTRALRHAATDTVALVGRALGDPEASVRVALPDAAGRLRVVASAGPAATAGRRRSSRRREVFRSGRSVAIDISDDGSSTLSILPLGADDQTIGVLEVVAPREHIAGRRDAILALVRQSAALMKVSKEREVQDRSTHGMERLLELATALEGASGPVSAMSAVARACHEHLAAASAVVRPDRDGAGWFLAAATGMGSHHRTELRRSLRAVRQFREAPAQHRDLERAFRAVAGTGAMSLAAGEALVLIAAEDERSGFARVAALMLGRTLAYLTGRDGATRDVGVGMAWTAHELRGPLAGAKAALEQVLSGPPEADGLDLLRRTKVELEHLTDLVDPLLQWSAGPHELRFEPTDLVGIVRGTVASTGLEGDRHRVIVEAPAGLPLVADAPQLRAAVGNLVRNALAYAPRSTDVHVMVEDLGDVARVYVRDLGPGIRPEERRTLFDPFVRGEEARSIRSGKGLGLFIARRVAEAHGGTVRLEPGSVGATFCLEVPVRGGLGSAGAGLRRGGEPFHLPAASADR